MRDEKLHARETHFQVKMYKPHQLRTTFGSWERRCGAKHISKSKVEKTQGFGALLDVRMSFCVAGTGDSVPCQKWAKRKGFVAASTTTTTTHTHTLHYTPLRYITLQPQLQLQLHYITLHYSTLVALHYTPLHYTTLNYPTLHSAPLHYTTLHYDHNYSYIYNFTTLHYTTLF